MDEKIRKICEASGIIVITLYAPACLTLNRTYYNLFYVLLGIDFK